MTHTRIAALPAEQFEHASCLAREEAAGLFSLRFAAEQEVVARRREEIDHLGVFAEPCFVLRTSWNDHDVAAANFCTKS
jgi:hypothetical protein